MSFPDYDSRQCKRQYPYGVVNPLVSSCYSSLAAYGVHGEVKGIVAPTPVSVVPIVFNKLGHGHPYSAPARNYRTVYNYPNHAPLTKNCRPYVTMNQPCSKGEFNQMYNDRRHRK